jgi:hypothetical protein
VLLDNMSPDTLRAAVAMIDGRSSPRSTIGALWVIQPVEIRSTPVAATAPTVSRLIPTRANRKTAALSRTTGARAEGDPGKGRAARAGLSWSIARCRSSPA